MAFLGKVVSKYLDTTFVFIRWQKRQGHSGESWYCYLCESRRQEGKPISRTLGYLGSIRGELAPLAPCLESRTGR